MHIIKKYTSKLFSDWLPKSLTMDWLLLFFFNHQGFLVFLSPHIFCAFLAQFLSLAGMRQSQVFGLGKEGISCHLTRSQYCGKDVQMGKFGLLPRSPACAWHEWEFDSHGEYQVAAQVSVWHHPTCRAIQATLLDTLNLPGSYRADEICYVLRSEREGDAHQSD